MTMDGVMADPLQLQFGPLIIDLERYQVRLHDVPVVLAYRDYALLVYLATRAGQVVHRRQLLEEGLGRHDWEGLRLVDERVRHLKHLLEQGRTHFIQPVGELGYRFEPARTGPSGAPDGGTAAGV
jgi:DNA-binding response OmpR family regulator